jgi:hypothetical protein
VLESLSSAAMTRDALAAPCWLLVNILACAAGWKWARRLFPRDSYLELIGHTVIFFWTGIVAAGTALGATGLLSGPALLLTGAALALGALAALRLRPCKTQWLPIPLDHGERWWLALWAVLLAFWIGDIITEGLLRFPMDFDSLSYHIPLVNHWLQTGSLYTTACARWANPGNNELLALWMVAPFSGDFLISLNNLPTVVLFACASVGFAKQLALPRPLAHLAGLAFVGNHVVLRQLVDTENDVAVAACFFAALGYTFKSIRCRGVAPLLLGALSLGILAGIKYYAVGYAALVLAVWVLWTARREGWRVSLGVLLAGVAGVLALGGYWYLRNLCATGSPLFPRELFKHPDMLAQIYPDVAHTSFFGNNRPELLNLYLKAIWRMTGPCQLIGFILVPVSLAWLLGTAARSVFQRHNAAPAEARFVLAVLLAGTGLLLGSTPFAVEDDPGTLNQMRWQYCPVRYGLCFLSTATLAALILVQDLCFTAPVTKSGTSVGPQERRRRALLPMLACLALAGAIVFALTKSWRALALNQISALLIAADLVLIALNLVMIKNL